MILERDGQQITSVEEWGRLAAPKRPIHWKPGRSAYELANAWCRCGPSPPDEVVALFDSHKVTRGATITSATPELRIDFDRAGGEPRNADLGIVAKAAAGILAITVEAKADEPFGDPVSTVLADAVDRVLEGRSRGVQRVTELAESLLPPRREERAKRPALKKLRYQLLTAAGGTVAFANQLGAKHAVFLIHEFVTDLTVDRKHQRNAADLNLFIRRLTGGQVLELHAGELIGPLSIPGRPLFPHPPHFYVGKVLTDRRMSRE